MKYLTWLLSLCLLCSEQLYAFSNPINKSNLKGRKLPHNVLENKTLQNKPDMKEKNRLFDFKLNAADDVDNVLWSCTTVATANSSDSNNFHKVLDVLSDVKEKLSSAFDKTLLEMVDNKEISQLQAEEMINDIKRHLDNGIQVANSTLRISQEKSSDGRHAVHFVGTPFYDYDEYLHPLRGEVVDSGLGGSDRPGRPDQGNKNSSDLSTQPDEKQQQQIRSAVENAAQTVRIKASDTKRAISEQVHDASNSASQTLDKADSVTHNTIDTALNSADEAKHHLKDASAHKYPNLRTSVNSAADAVISSAQAIRQKAASKAQHIKNEMKNKAANISSRAKRLAHTADEAVHFADEEVASAAHEMKDTVDDLLHQRTLNDVVSVAVDTSKAVANPLLRKVRDLVEPTEESLETEFIVSAPLQSTGSTGNNFSDNTCKETLIAVTATPIACPDSNNGTDLSEVKMLIPVIDCSGDSEDTTATLWSGDIEHIPCSNMHFNGSFEETVGAQPAAVGTDLRNIQIELDNDADKVKNKAKHAAADIQNKLKNMKDETSGCHKHTNEKVSDGVHTIAHKTAEAVENAEQNAQRLTGNTVNKASAVRDKVANSLYRADKSNGLTFTGAAAEERNAESVANAARNIRNKVMSALEETDSERHHSSSGSKLTSDVDTTHSESQEQKQEHETLFWKALVGFKNFVVHDPMEHIRLQAVKPRGESVGDEEEEDQCPAARI